VNDLRYFDGYKFGIEDLLFEPFEITSTRQTFTFIGSPITLDGVTELTFRGGNKMGTYYVKVVSITEVVTQ
jgi:hypothetical protein